MHGATVKIVLHDIFIVLHSNLNQAPTKSHHTYSTDQLLFHSTLPAQVTKRH